MDTLSITATAKKFPHLAYAQMKNDILGKTYNVSLAFVGSTTARNLNIKHRKKTYVPNVLSFALDDKNGEIFITPVVARKEAKRFNMTPNGYIGFLFIHALLHLKGHDHGDTMDTAEKKYCMKYDLH